MLLFNKKSYQDRFDEFFPGISVIILQNFTLSLFSLPSPGISKLSIPKYSFVIEKIPREILLYLLTNFHDFLWRNLPVRLHHVYYQIFCGISGEFLLVEQRP